MAKRLNNKVEQKKSPLQKDNMQLEKLQIKFAYKP